jgi:hypothetical protein
MIVYHAGKIMGWRGRLGRQSRVQGLSFKVEA